MRKAREIIILTAIILTFGTPSIAQTPTNKTATAQNVARLAAKNLTRGDLTPESYAFKQKVYELHVKRNENAGRERVFDLSPDALKTIPGTKILMRWDAAIALGELLKAANQDLISDKKSDDSALAERRKHAENVKEIALNNAYRSASTQFGIWDRNFARYLTETVGEREKQPGGEYGESAANLLRDYIGVRVAAPGYSNHQGGVAVDFALKLNDDKTLTASTAQTNPWKESWFWDWLNRHAHEFGFVAYLPEPWHWEYKPNGVART